MPIEVKSNDLGLITALICIGFEPKQIIRENNIIYYVFVADNLDKYVNDYWHSQLNVSALSFFTTLKSVKVTVYGILGK